jgi:AcrR family transcriptional regulator
MMYGVHVGCRKSHGVHCERRRRMAYPAKTDRAAILKAGMTLLAAEGLSGLSLRALAASLQLAPNALYRYFADRAALEAALAAEVARRLNLIMKKSAAGREPEAALRSMAHAYLRFAREHRKLYDTMMSACDLEGEDAEAHATLWAFVVEHVKPISGEANSVEAAVALWAFLHGVAGLESADILDKDVPPRKPVTAIDFGLNVWFAGAGQKKG